MLQVLPYPSSAWCAWVSLEQHFLQVALTSTTHVTHRHSILHLSCSKDFKCIEGLWERTSWTKSRKENYTESFAYATSSAASLLEKEHIALLAILSRSPWLGVPRLTATGKTCCCSSEVCGVQGCPAFLPPIPEKHPPGHGTSQKNVA